MPTWYKIKEYKQRNYKQIKINLLNDLIDLTI